jgi:hypothetical protein
MKSALKSLSYLFAVLLILVGTVTIGLSQETTGSLQGTVKDPSGAVIPSAKVTVTTPTLVGGKSTVTDGKGYYHFSNLPPGNYVITVDAKGFTTLKREGVVIEVGHSPSVDLPMSVGAESTVVEVSAQGPEIDVTATSTTTNLTQNVIDNIPHGASFQSAIQFAPMARNEPLMGATPTMGGNGTGGSSPGNASSGSKNGYSIGGASDSENDYLVEGQETADIIGGFTHTSVPFDFIEEMSVKTSGVDAEFRGALGGVVNVVMKKGTNNWHGSVFAQLNKSFLNGSPNGISRYDPTASPTVLSTGYTLDPGYQQYQRIKDKTGDFLPGIFVSGPIWKDRVFGFVGFNPEFQADERFVNFSGTEMPFSQNTQTYYGNARVDVAVTRRIKVFGSWLYQGQRESGQSLPDPDDINGLFNTSAQNDPSNYAHSIGYDAPNLTTNFGADINILQSLVSTTRFGYFFANYHDFGYPTANDTYQWQDSSLGAYDIYGKAGGPAHLLPAALQQAQFYTSQAIDSGFTHRNAEKHIQFDEAIGWYKSGWAGTHNFKFGYQLNKQSDDILQGYNAPYIQVFAGSGLQYTFGGTQGQAACTALVASHPTAINPTTHQNYYGQYSTAGALIGCSGQYGYETVYDVGTGGTATSFNHAIFAQDSWTLGKGLTINAGVRVEKEYLPAENQPNGQLVEPINFSWSDKIAPRIGAAWDVFQDGKMKVFGHYGVFNDIMKLNLAISSYGGQYWDNCAYALDNPSATALSVTPNAAGRYCPANPSPALVSGGTTPTGLTFLENQNFRAFPTTCPTCSANYEGTVPNIKPYRQHESAFGFDYQLSHSLAFEARWDRHRLDHVIEDSSLFNPATGGETFVVVNPGQGVNNTFNNFWTFLYGSAPPPCSGTGCPPAQIVPAARSYDGVEFRLDKAVGNNWEGEVSYTYSNLRGNYSGLTSSDLGDGGGGRNAPNNGRSFDEPFFSYNSHGQSSSGPLNTDRPNTVKAFIYYHLPWMKWKQNSTTFGLFQVFYQGSPVSSYMDVGYSFAPGADGGFPTFIEGRGKYVSFSQDPSTGFITVGTPYARRTPMYKQSDFNLKHTYQIKEAMSISFDATFTNILNQHRVTSYNTQVDSNNTPSFIAPNNQAIYDGESAYAAYERPYNYKGLVNSQQMTIDSQYGTPYTYEQPRNIRLQAHFTF